MTISKQYELDHNPHKKVSCASSIHPNEISPNRQDVENVLSFSMSWYIDYSQVAVSTSVAPNLEWWLLAESCQRRATIAKDCRFVFAWHVQMEPVWGRDTEM